MNINSTLTDMAIVAIDPIDAKRIWREFRVANGWAPNAPILTPPDGNAKYLKDLTVVTYGLSLAQSNTSGVANVCPFSTAGCRAACVAKNGNGAFNKTQDARALKVKFLLAHPAAMLTLIAAEIDAAYSVYGGRLRVRLNTFSDIRWEEVAPWLFTDRPYVSFYDYTKDWNRIPPSNYRLTLSASERQNVFAIRPEVKSGQNVAVVFGTRKQDALPTEWHGMRVVDGDKSDNRANDPFGVIVGLRAKGRMRNDRTGMVGGV